MNEGTEHRPALRQADQVRTAFAAVEMPISAEIAQTALGTILRTAGLVIAWM
jgi:hypothetical protein